MKPRMLLNNSGLKSHLWQSGVFMMFFFMLIGLNLPAQITVTIDYYASAGCSNNNGNATANATGGTPPYTYQWSSGENWQSIANVGPGNLSVTVTDSNWGTGSANMNINIPDPLDVTVDGGDYDCWNDNNSMTAMVTGGTAPFNFNWSNGSTSQSLTNLNQTDYYFVTVTDSKGCVKVAGKSYVEPMALEVNSIDGTCFGACDGSINVAVEGGIAPFFFQWDYGFQPSSQIQTVAPFGDYNVTVTDGMGCTKTAFGQVNEPDDIVIAVDIATPCNDGSNVAAAVTGGTPPYNITWNNGTNGPNAYLNTGTWFVKVIDANNCAKEEEVQIMSASNLNLQVSATNANCQTNMGQATVDIVGGNSTYTYEWSNGALDKTVTDLQPGDYTVTVSNAGGCTEVAQVTIEEPTEIEIDSYTTTPSGCHGDNGTATVNPIGGTGAYYFNWNDPLTQGGQTAYQLAPGTYLVTVTDDAGCSGTMEIEVPDESIDVVVDITNASCEDTPSGKLETSISSGGTAPFTYAWSNGQTTPNLTAVPAGWYGVTITDATGCTEEQMVEVLDESMQVDIEITNLGCFGADDTALETVIENGQAPFTIQWSNGTQAAAIGSLPEGNYTVTVTDAAGCEKEADVLISTPEIEVNMDMTNESCEDAANGTAQVAVAVGGTAPFAYAWSNGETSEAVANLTAGTYEVVVTDANGCTQTNFVEIETVPFEVIVNVSNADCHGNPNGYADVDVTNGGQAPFSYEWSDGTNQVSTTNLSVGQYSVIVTDAAGCTQAKDFDVETNSPADAAIGWEIVDCTEDGMLIQFNDLSSLNGTNTVAWEWSLSTNQVSVQQNPIFLIPDENVSAQLTITTSDGCEDVVTEDFTLDLINYAVENIQTVCQSAYHEVNLDLTSQNVTIDWSPDNLILSGDGTTNPVISTADAGQYTLSVKLENAAGCVIEDQVEITIEPATAMDPVDMTYKQCKGLQVDFEITNATQDFVWFFNYPDDPTASASGTNPSFEYTEPGTYTIAIEPVGDCAETQFLTVDVGEGAVADFEFEMDNCVNPVIVQFTDVSNIPSGDIVGWNWDFGVLGTSNEQNPSITITNDQGVVASLSVEYGDGCVVEVEQDFNVVMFNPPYVLSNAFNCQAGADVELNPGGDPNFSYLWSPANLLDDPTAVSPTATVNSTTTFNVVITDTNGSGCSTSAQVTLELPDTPLVLDPLEDVTSCDYEQVTLIANANTTIDVTWSLDEDFATIYSNEPSLTVTPGNNPTTFYLMVTTADGCEATEEVTVSNLATGLTFDDAFEICKGEIFDYEFQGVDPAEDFTNWSPYDPFENPVLDNTVFTYEYSNGFGCEGSGTFTVNVIEFPEELEATASIVEVFPGQTSNLSINSNPNFTYNWTPNQTLSGGNTSNPIARPLESTVYTVEVTDESSGCRSSDEILVKVKESICEEPYIYVPNAFTPNKDGVNDVLYVRGENIDEVYMTIYDRWGEKVFETDNLDEGWDGSFNGKTVSGDVYGYYLKIICYGGREYFKKGNITVLR